MVRGTPEEGEAILPDKPPIDSRRLQTVSQAVFGLAFLALVAVGQTRLWVLVFGAGLLTVRLGGRWYCGWACPIYAAFRVIDVVYDKLEWQRRSIPAPLQSMWVRWGAVVLAVGVAVVGRVMGIQIPVILLITIAGIVVGLAFVEATFHRHLCPFGTVLAAVGGTQWYGLSVTPDACIGCGQCQTACPNDTIETQGDDTREIHNGECLDCFACDRACPTDAISYEGLSKVE